MYNIPDHPDIASALATGEPCGYWQTHALCSRCGDAYRLEPYATMDLCPECLGALWEDVY